MKIIVGLGNPGSKYALTRHNAGFEVADILAVKYNINILKLKCKALIGEGSILGERVLLVKPQTYMNLSGECVRDLLHYYKLEAKDILVIYDDCSLPVGDIRIRPQGSDGGHNGIRNILYHLETDVFDRVRVGIGQKPDKWVLSDYVLSRFAANELEKIELGIKTAAEACAVYLQDGIQNAMNKYNKKITEPASNTPLECNK